MPVKLASARHDVAHRQISSAQERRRRLPTRTAVEEGGVGRLRVKRRSFDSQHGGGGGVEGVPREGRWWEDGSSQASEDGQRAKRLRRLASVAHAGPCPLRFRFSPTYIAAQRRRDVLIALHLAHAVSSSNAQRLLGWGDGLEALGALATDEATEKHLLLRCRFPRAPGPTKPQRAPSAPP